MGVQNQCSDVKEQKNLVGTFSLFYKTKGQESAWRFYSGLNPVEKIALRTYRSDNGVVDFSMFLQEVQDSRPCGMADKVTKLSFLETINAELETISLKERKSYLNGKPLTLEV